MIIESIRLKYIFDLILHLDFDFPKFNLEISKKNEDFLIIAANYSDRYYISFTINISNEINRDNYNVDYMVISKKSVLKIYQLITLWPKSIIKIDNYEDVITCEVISHGSLVRENPVHVECTFELSINDYIIESPNMNYNCIVNSKNLKQMLEFCNSVDSDICLEIKNNSLSISTSDTYIATLVELDKLIKKPSNKIILPTEANNLIISFLNKIVNKYNLLYLLFIEHDHAFSIKINIDDLNTLQIYTIHN